MLLKKNGFLIETGKPIDILIKNIIKNIIDIDVLISNTEYGQQFYPVD